MTLPAVEDAYLDTSEAGAYLGGIKPHTLEIWRSSGRYGIPFIRVGRLIRYRRSDLDRWLASRAVNVEQEAA